MILMIAHNISKQPQTFSGSQNEKTLFFWVRPRVRRFIQVRREIWSSHVSITDFYQHVVHYDPPPPPRKGKRAQIRVMLRRAVNQTCAVKSCWLDIKTQKPDRTFFSPSRSKAKSKWKRSSDVFHHVSTAGNDESRENKIMVLQERPAVQPWNRKHTEWKNKWCTTPSRQLTDTHIRWENTVDGVRTES